MNHADFSLDLTSFRSHSHRYYDKTNSAFRFRFAFTATVTKAQLLINEVDSDTPGSDTLEFVELVNGGISGIPLSGVSLVFYNGAGDVSYFSLDLNPAITLAPGAFYVIGNPSVANVAQTFDPGSAGLLQNGADAVALYNAPASTFPTGTAVTATNLLDAVVYDTADPDDTGLLDILTPGEPQINESATGSSPTVSFGRIPDGFGGARDTSFYATTQPTPGAANLVVPEPSAGAMMIGGIGLLAFWRRDRRARGWWTR
jgi:hypothetical protein